MKDYAHIDTSPKMNRYEMTFYCVTFVIVLVGVTIALPMMLVGLL